MKFLDTLRLLPGRFRIGQEQKTIFFHIPKTGGSTFRTILLQIYGSNYHYCENPDVTHIQKQLSRHRCIELHVGNFEGSDIYFHRDIIQERYWNYLRRFHLFVMFRDPVARVISNYFQLSRKRFTEAKKEPLPLTRDTLNERLHNKQVGYILGYHPASNRIPNKSDLESAKHVLASLPMTIGIMERYNESLQLFEHVTGMKIPERMIRIENSTGRSVLEKVDAETKEFIREKNLLDQELYQYAIQLFEKQLAGINFSPEKQFLFERANDSHIPYSREKG